MSGEDRLRERNYFAVYLGTEPDTWLFWVQALNRRGVTGLWFPEDGRDGRAASIPNACLRESRLYITYYLRELRLEYRSAVSFILSQITGIPRGRLAIERVGRFLFGKRTLVRRDRMTVLHLIYEQTLLNRDYRDTPWGIMTELFGPRWVHHPDHEPELRFYTLVLDSLTESGDLLIEDGSYRLAPQALSTLSNHEEDNRRHGDSIRQQTWLAIFTLALVLVGLLQAYVNWK